MVKERRVCARHWWDRPVDSSQLTVESRATKKRLRTRLWRIRSAPVRGLRPKHGSCSFSRGRRNGGANGMGAQEEQEKRQNQSPHSPNPRMGLPNSL